MKIGIDRNMSARTRIQAVRRPVTGVILIILILFVSTGRWDYWQGWLYFSLFVINLLLNWILIPTEVVRERARIQPGTKKWDLVIYISVILLSYATPLVAVLDGWKYHWSGDIPLGVNLAAFAAVFLGNSLLDVCIWKNRFFSGTVRIQKDRNQTVVATGPYAVIRHPGYAGLILSFAATPLALNSLWAFIPAGLAVTALVVRTYWEDRTLTRELRGYQKYVARVRFRLIPGIW